MHSDDRILPGAPPKAGKEPRFIDLLDLNRREIVELLDILRYEFSGKKPHASIHFPPSPEVIAVAHHTDAPATEAATASRTIPFHLLATEEAKST